MLRQDFVQGEELRGACQCGECGDCGQADMIPFREKSCGVHASVESAEARKGGGDREKRHECGECRGAEGTLNPKP